ncbi:dethiobiotin synthase [Solitalea canadensis]|uniref:ATP-dependent dethiobiotin synthetase BioD n=1 Tax=Solitalea canadensis (strain ATCC 29591 / DSM 3403 / JCM 21819 / LMG 8368 / NBRC 15130 / NCIMB 12057 / USAM 9D) TaxID=929556 RepID=H8KTK8_SOLCM|nr:dethiobiotin synthase [Solitalea canadensis]AFD06466.1 dethiobiotin synthase [Solitalea canadensis DSM 3403]
MKKPLFITGIGTGVGKTLISAIIVEKLNADYWKPIQSGDLHQSDTITIQSLISNSKTVFHPETYRLSQPFSPHKSARIDNVTIQLEKFILPETNNQLIIEGAGGLMVPLNDKALIIDLIEKLEAEVILVSRNYLGSINHTLLSIESLKNRNIPIKGLIFNGNEDHDSEDYILNHSKLACLGRIPDIPEIDRSIIIGIGNFLSI